eukprot:1959738-Rhodomonas_salina.1
MPSSCVYALSLLSSLFLSSHPTSHLHILARYNTVTPIALNPKTVASYGRLLAAYRRKHYGAAPGHVASTAKSNAITPQC